MTLPPFTFFLAIVLLASLPACSSTPPVPPLEVIRSEARGEFFKRAADAGLVNVAQYVPSVQIDLRYATNRNVTGAPFYPPGVPCLLQRDTAEKLRKAQEILAGRGYHLRIWDAYRPVEAHQVLWDKFGMSGYVHEPGYENRWSWHCYGRAVDVTLVDDQGIALQMPSDFDEFSPGAWARYVGGNGEVAARVRALQVAMQRAGFELLFSEWWHFSDPNPGPPGPPIYARDLGVGVPLSSGPTASGELKPPSKTHPGG